MPIIKPEVQKILRTAGLLNESVAETTTIETSLNNAGLDNTSMAEELTSLALRSQNESLRLRAIETALRVKGALKDATPQVPSFTIVINGANSDLSRTSGINPTLFPRQSYKPSKEIIEVEEEERVN